MSKKGQLSYAYCQFCKQSVPVKGVLGGGLRFHYKTIHAEYWRWNNRSGFVFLSGWLLIFSSLFVVLGLGLVPATGNSPLTWNFFIGWMAAQIGFVALFGVYRLRAGRRFRGSAGFLHPTPSRQYGHLQGMKVAMVFPRSRRSKLGSLVSFLDPLGIAVEALVRLELRGTHGKFFLDRFENGLLWYYTLCDILVSLQLEISTLAMVHEKRLMVESAGGTVEIETETVAELEMLRSIISGRAQSEPSFTTVVDRIP